MLTPILWMWHPRTYPSNSSLMKYVSLQFRDKDVVGDSVRLYRSPNIWPFLCPLLRLLFPQRPLNGQAGPAFGAAVLLSQITSLSYVCLSTPSRKIYSLILPDTEMRLTSKKFPWSCFLGFLNMGKRFPFSSHLGRQLTPMSFQISWSVAW